MPNTITSTTVPHFIAEGPLAVVHEVADIFEQADVSHSPLAAGLHTETLDDGPIYAAKQLAARQVYASALMKFHILGSDDAKVKKTAGDLVRRDSVASNTSNDDLESPPIPLV